MSKSSKAISKQKNLNKKRSIKASNRAKYERWKQDGENTKSTRAVRKAKGKKSPNKNKHLIAHCGNPACNKCFTTTDKGRISITKN